MGNKNSKEKSNSKNKSNSNSNNNGPTEQVKIQAGEEQKVEDTDTGDQTQSIKEEIEKCEALLAGVEQSMEEDKSIPNLIDNYAKLHSCSKPDLHLIGSSIAEMKEGWGAIMEQMDVIRSFGDKCKEKANTMTVLYADYWRLLLKTKMGIRRLLTQCASQKENIADLLVVISDGSKGELAADQKVEYEDCINELGTWIGAGVIASLTGEWAKISDRLQTESNDWKDVGAEVSKHLRNEILLKIAIVVVGTLVIIAIIAGITAAVVASGGTAAPVVGTVVVAQTTTAATAAGTTTAAVTTVSSVAGTVAGVTAAETAAVTTAGLATAAVVGIAAGVSGCVIIGSSIYGLHQGLEYRKQTAAVHSNVNAIIKRLENMLTSAKDVEDALTECQCTENDIEEGLKLLKDKKSVKKITKALKGLSKCLDEYLEQGDGVIVAIEGAIKKACT